MRGIRIRESNPPMSSRVGLDLPIEGQPTRALKPGDGFVVPANTPHAGGKNGDKKTRIASTYVVEKGKPLASPA